MPWMNDSKVAEPNGLFASSIANEVKLASMDRSDEQNSMQSHKEKLTAHYSVWELSFVFLGILLVLGFFIRWLDGHYGISLNIKLVGGITSILIAMAGAIAYSLISIGNIGTEIKTVAEEQIPLTEIVTNITKNQLEQEIHMERFFRTNEIEEQNKFDEYGKLVEEELKQGEMIADDIWKLAITDFEKNEALKIKEHLKILHEKHKVFQDDCKHAMIEGKNSGEYTQILLKCEEISKVLESDVTNFLTSIEERTKNAVISAEQHELDSDSFLISQGIASIVLGLLVLAMIWGASVSLVANVRKSADSLLASSNSVSASSSQFRSNSEKLAAMTQQQAAGVQEIMATLDELNAISSKNAEHTNLSSFKADECKNGALQGKESIEEVNVAIEDISQDNKNVLDQIQKSNNQMTEISKIIGLISQKTNVINDIVFQTKLLSFNASVEAARAGDHGKGFAVVAEEVGKLAQMSGTASQEIRQMLSESIEKVERIVDESSKNAAVIVESSRKKVENGLLKVEECNKIFSDVVENIAEVNVAIVEISRAAKEHEQGIDSISIAVREIDAGTQEVAIVSREAANASEELSIQAGSLQSNSSVLIEIIEGKQAKLPEAEGTKVSNNLRLIESALKKRNHSNKPPRKAMVSGSDIVPVESDDRFEDV